MRSLSAGRWTAVVGSAAELGRRLNTIEEVGESPSTMRQGLMVLGQGETARFALVWVGGMGHART